MLKSRMPMRAVHALESSRRQFSHLEAVGRLLAGIAPYLELQHAESGGASGSGAILAADARAMLDHISDQASPDYLNFFTGRQPLVDAAFLAQGLLRAPRALWHGLEEATRRRLVACLKATRSIRPGFNNWLLFSAMIEAFLFTVGEEWDYVRIDYAVRQHDEWYKGDGHYGDGPAFHADYYNSYVIHPMLLDVLACMHQQSPHWDKMYTRELVRAARYAEVLERMVGPDGSFPPLGRSLAYRCGVFHLLALLAWKEKLPATLPPAQVRGALLAVIAATLGARSNFDDNGWLQIGLSGHQPAIGEDYISTGSLYLCATTFLPLGLPSSNRFWSDPDLSWTQRRVWWQQENINPDKALKT